MMRIASVLLVAVLLSTCAISGTFAKYATTVNNADSARVAAWGFGNSTTISFELFSESYDTGKVQSKDAGVNVIAPGTTQTEMVTLNYANTSGKGAPEVAYTIDINVVSAETSIGANIESNQNIVWSFNGQQFDHSGDTSSWEKMLSAIEAYHENVSANALPTISNTGISISWEWIWNENAIPDTNLGDAPSLESVNLKIEIVAQQVD